jgi:hypothetical protein
MTTLSSIGQARVVNKTFQSEGSFHQELKKLGILQSFGRIDALAP